MDSNNSPRRSRRTRHEDDDSYDRERKSRRSHRDDSDRHRGKDRDREGSRDRDRRRRRRSRSPRSPDSHRQARERERYRDRDHRRKRSPDDKCRDRDHSRRKRDGDTETGDDESRGKQMVKRSGPLPSQSDSFALTQGEEPPKPKEKPNYGTTGTLAAVSNSVVQSDGSTIVLKYHEPPEARKPKDQWRLFIFKGQEIVDTVELSHRTCWLIGREVAVVDLAAEHPSISKQHAVIQFRYLEKRNEYGDKIGKVKPYLIDLESANGTMLNSKKVPESRYLELRDKDLIQFGQSTREYVLMLAPKD